MKTLTDHEWWAVRHEMWGWRLTTLFGSVVGFILGYVAGGSR